MVPIQLTLPAPAGSQDTQPRVYSIQVPASALACKLVIANFEITHVHWSVLCFYFTLKFSFLADQLQRILTAQLIQATMALPVNVASTLLQQHVTAALQGQANATNSMYCKLATKKKFRRGVL